MILLLVLLLFVFLAAHVGDVKTSNAPGDVAALMLAVFAIMVIALVLFGGHGHLHAWR